MMMIFSFRQQLARGLPEEEREGGDIQESVLGGELGERGGLPTPGLRGQRHRGPRGVRVFQRDR